MSRQRDKGTRFEQAVVDHLSVALDAEPGAIHRLTTHGARDVGDVGGLKAHGRPVVVECKDCQTQRMAEWLGEADVERGNADALAAVVVSHRRGVGLTRMGEQLVSMTLDDLVAIVTGVRP